MGGKSSKSRGSHSRSHGYGHTSSRSTPRYSSYNGNYMPPETVDRVQRKYTRIGDNYQTLNQMCPICLWQSKDLAFGCGHQTCHSCGKDMEICPICQSQISTRIRLY